MRAFATYALVVTTLVASASPALGQSEQLRQADTTSDRNVVAFSLRAEEGMLSSLRDSAPLIEAYLQHLVPAAKLGYMVDSDRYFLGRFKWSNDPTMEGLLNYQKEAEIRDARKSASDTQLLDGLAQLMAPDWKLLGPERYDYKFAGVTFLGAVRCLVYDVKPLKSEDEGFTGRLYIEGKSWNIVRFTGMNAHVDTMLAALRQTSSTFRVDSWRVNVVKNRWVPAYAYIEEVTPLDTTERPLVKGQIRFWGYDPRAAQQHQQFTDIVLHESPSTVDGAQREWPSPLQSVRLFERQAEENVMARLVQGRFLGATGDVEKMLEQVVTNLIVTNKLVLAAPVHVRVLLTTPLEAFSVGDTIVVSRGLIDVLPTESAIALVLAHQLAHNVLGHRKVDSKLSFADVLRVTDSELLAKLRFRHTAGEEAAADVKAMEILEQSPYKDGMSDGGLFMQAVQARAKQLSALVQPQFGEHVADVEHAVRNNDMFRTTPVLDVELVDQVAALPLGSRLLVNPLDGRVQLLRSDPILAPALRERAELAVTPFIAFLDYAAAEKSAAAEPPNADAQRVAGGGGALSTPSVPPALKRKP